MQSASRVRAVLNLRGSPIGALQMRDFYIKQMILKVFPNLCATMTKGGYRVFGCAAVFGEFRSKHPGRTSRKFHGRGRILCTAYPGGRLAPAAFST